METPKVYQGWTAGARVRVIEDADLAGLCAGDEGVLRFEVVGAPQYNNERVIAVIDIDDEYHDPGIEVALDNIEEF